MEVHIITMGEKNNSSRKTTYRPTRGGSRYFVNNRVYGRSRGRKLNFPWKKPNINPQFLGILILLPVLFLLGFFIFHTPQATLVIKASEGGNVLEPGVGNFSVARGEVTTLSVEPEEGWEFKGWEGDATGPEDTLVLEMDGNKEVRAVFEPIEYGFRGEVEGQGELQVSPQKETYRHGESLVLKVEAKEGWRFKGWEGDAAGVANTLELEIKDDTNVRAVFEPIQFSFRGKVEGQGDLQVSPQKETYRHGESLVLEVKPKEGWQFAGWEGDVSGRETKTTLEVDRDLEVLAVFSPREYSVSLKVEGGGDYEISPEKDSYSHGDTIRIKALEKPGFRFSHWSGDLSGGANPVEVKVDRNIQASAVFERPPTLSEGDTGDKVQYLQKQLAVLGFYPDQPDGNFGLQTKLAVKKAQIFFGLTVDGVAGPATWTAMESERGTFLYTVNRGDTLWALAQRWNTTVSHIRDINNLSNPDLLVPGDQLLIPGVGEVLPVKDLHWQEVQRLFPREGEALITDVETGLSFRVKRYGGTYHADVEPLTAQDTNILRRICGGSWCWERRAVIVAIGSNLIAGSINGYPHGGQSITHNNFPGHICLHFKGSSLHLNSRSDPEHQAEIEKAAESTWPAGN